MMKSTLLLLSLGAFSACADDAMTAKGVDPDTAPVASVDRFSDGFAHLFKRSGPAFDPANVQPIVPAPNAPIDFDTYFTVRALGPAGEDIRYYSLDIVPKVPATGYVVVSAGTPVPDQLDIIDKLPGEAGYNDFVRITEVEVGKGYVANTMTSAADPDGSPRFVGVDDRNRSGIFSARGGISAIARRFRRHDEPSRDVAFREKPAPGCRDDREDLRG
jgi:hypothetical protein